MENTQFKDWLANKMQDPEFRAEFERQADGPMRGALDRIGELEQQLAAEREARAKAEADAAQMRLALERMDSALCDHRLCHEVMCRENCASAQIWKETGAEAALATDAGQQWLELARELADIANRAADIIMPILASVGITDLMVTVRKAEDAGLLPKAAGSCRPLAASVLLLPDYVFYRHLRQGGGV